MFDLQHGAPGGRVPKRILVVEDDYDLAREMAAAVSDTGAYVVGPVPTIDRAVNAINLQNVDGAVIDLRLQDGPAYAVADLLTRFGVPFVFATGYSEMLPVRFSSVPVFHKPAPPKTVAKALADLTQERNDRLSYSVRKLETVWEWTVFHGTCLLARGHAGTSISARVEALKFVGRLNDP
jgi:ActR/RegA family two-component response regulator